MERYWTDVHQRISRYWTDVHQSSSVVIGRSEQAIKIPPRRIELKRMRIHTLAFGLILVITNVEQ